MLAHAANDQREQQPKQDEKNKRRLTWRVAAADLRETPFIKFLAAAADVDHRVALICWPEVMAITLI